MTSLAPPRANPPDLRFLIPRSHDLRAEFPKTFHETGGINGDFFKSIRWTVVGNQYQNQQQRSPSARLAALVEIPWLSRG